jgi:hypothetical protein
MYANVNNKPLKLSVLKFYDTSDSDVDATTFLVKTHLTAKQFVDAAVFIKHKLEGDGNLSWTFEDVVLQMNKLGWIKLLKNYYNEYEVII